MQSVKKTMASENLSGGKFHSRVPHVPTNLDPELGEVVVAVLEDDNIHNCYAVAILENEMCCAVGRGAFATINFKTVILFPDNGRSDQS